ncbi:MAG: serine/threonine protein phosphatase [Sphingobacteriales bacterium]|nr:serine/threonine protein phosphatase [Sphingobacteriales bacterium]OJY80814.1 MAG: serine/threonine protein phosphatase [Sphingobacteriales bacterium 44-15]
MKRRLVIGDIHGGLRALLQVFDRAAVTTDDILIFLGDYVDGWSESPQVIDYLIELSARQQCIILKGNHDEWCEVWLRTGDADSSWLFHGGQSTVNGYSTVASYLRRQHLHFFEQMQLYYIDENNRLFVHAGFTSMHGPQHELYPSNVAWDRTLWETARSMRDMPRESLLYPKRLKLFDEIFIGHTPTLYYDVDVPMRGGNVWNIDTGAAFKGRLTVMNIASKEYWQSDPLPALYPGEAGRNRD